MIHAVLHVLFARPQQLDRDARHLLGNGHRLPNIVGLATAAEAAAENLLVDVTFLRRQAGGFQHGGESSLPLLRSPPHLPFFGAIEPAPPPPLTRAALL